MKDLVPESIKLLPEQAKQAWRETSKLKIPRKYGLVKNIFILGMGGSGFAPEMVKFLYRDELTISCEVYHGYGLPRYVNGNSLLLLSSYSGTTDEVLDAGKQGLAKKLKMIGITRGDRLAKFMRQNNIPGYIFDEKNNPSKQPRLGSGYMVIGIIGLLKKSGLFKIGNDQVEQAIKFIGKRQKALLIDGKNIARLLKNKIPIIIVAEFLEGNGRALRNQVNENAKNFAEYQTIPELNHHLMEGLKFPESNKKNLIFLFIKSKLYLQENQKRFKVTKEVVRKNKIKCLELMLMGKTKLEQSLELFSLGSYLSYYLSKLNRVDPQKIPWVDYFKKKLAAS